jgi:hypothetical protein
VFWGLYRERQLVQVLVALDTRWSASSRLHGKCARHFDGHFVGYAVSVPTRVPFRRRPKITATLDPDLLASVDAYVAVHPDVDRSAVIDAALRLWHARQLELALAAQFATPDGVDPAERQAWDELRRAATVRQLGPRDSA